MRGGRGACFMLGALGLGSCPSTRLRATRDGTVADSSSSGPWRVRLYYLPPHLLQLYVYLDWLLRRLVQLCTVTCISYSNQYAQSICSKKPVAYSCTA